MNADLVRDIALHGPSHKDERVLLTILAAMSDERRRVAVSPRQLGTYVALGEHSVRMRLNRLIEENWLKAVSENCWEIRGSHVRTRARGRGITPTPLEITPNPPGDADQHRESVGRAQYSAPRGEGQRKSLGIVNCPRCGGTGWEEVEGAKPGYFTVDICHCRGGPIPRPTSVIPEPEPKRSGPDPVQIMTNLQGIDRARKEMRNEAGTEARTSPLQDRSVVPDSEADPGTG